MATDTTTQSTMPSKTGNTNGTRAASERQVVDMMTHLSGSEQRQILSQMETVDLRAGEILAEQGAHGREFYLLVDGTVEIHRDDTVIATFNEGDFFGEISALTNARRTATVVATEDITVEVMNRRQLATVLDLWPELAAQVQTAAQDRLASTS